MINKVLETGLFYCASVNDYNSLQLKQFIPRHEEDNLKKYLVKVSKIHESEGMFRTYIIADQKTDAMVGWFSLQSATLPYQKKDSQFHIPAIELTNFAVNERYYKDHKDEFSSISIGTRIYFQFILPIAFCVARLIGCRVIYLFALNKPKLIKYYEQCLGFRTFDKMATDDFIKLPRADYCKDLVFMYGGAVKGFVYNWKVYCTAP